MLFKILLSHVSVDSLVDLISIGMSRQNVAVTTDCLQIKHHAPVIDQA
jgi:hypothetical protein